ncbi:hypothetical protein LK07_11745 [Streptomyces pluripotens]|uniref:Secreted protein n=1 Tax=Streptomyces pluripotens TaxID=1355015 RepID=A0A221NXR8_9ACTN|nr:MULTISPECIES: hypothetical protein [Streptomyces]ARP70344.1 hypothetical protein LK06_010625 [Streptomyces pluripotens]ASN24598.1 hypothetical protein LK07_11745 [Streptomyces pluripotens]KIE28174.1 hypothetical protein LK08_04015 [Streptomyces sp. MUSC 125]MCH0558940.1 hypothetical protein [Streptomyces sp. MUM 16J]
MGSGAIRRRLALAAAVLTASGALAFTAAGTAQAVTAHGCAGREVRTLPFRTGTTYVYRHGGYLCVVTVTRRPGTTSTMSVSVQARGNRPVVDKGRYKYYAGPVVVHAGHRCVRIKGAVGRYAVSSGWILC